MWREKSAAAVAAILFLALAQAQTPPASEYQVKAAFLYNFAKFIEWPGEAFASADVPIRICVLGEDPFGRDLEQIVSGKQVGGRPVQAVALRRLAEARTCHILFVSSAEASQLRHVLEATAALSVVVVSERPGAAEQGATINFVLQDDRIRFEINTKAAAAGRLKISSKLLSLASKVID